MTTPTPSLIIDLPTVKRNLARLADYARNNHLAIRPHTKTHKSLRMARMQLDAGAKGLTVAALEKMGHKTIPSEANFIMFELGTPASPVIKAMKEKNVEVGRLFPAMPNHMRLTIGKKNEMEAFLAAFRQVLPA